MARSRRFRYAVGVGVVALAAVASALVYPRLPATMTVHWSAGSTPDGTMSRPLGAFLMPAIAAVLLGLFAVLPRIDPLGENVREALPLYDWFAVLVVVLLAYVHALVLAWNLGARFHVGQAIAPALAVVYYGAGVVSARVRPNWFLGIRTPWTLSSDTVWRRTHERVAPLLKAAGIVALGAVLYPDALVVFAVGPAVAVSIYATVYSYLLYRREGGG